MTSQYVIQFDTIHDDVHNIPQLALAVMGYDTGTADIKWTAADYARFPVASKVHVDQSPDLSLFAANGALIADVEPGAGTIATLKPALQERHKKGWTSLVYCSYANWDAVQAAVTSIGLHAVVSYGIANYNLSQSEAVAFLNEELSVDFVQFASPQSNPGTVLPGGTMTLREANVDLSVKRDTWVPSEGIPAVGWVE